MWLNESDHTPYLCYPDGFVDIALYEQYFKGLEVSFGDEQSDGTRSVNLISEIPREEVFTTFYVDRDPLVHYYQKQNMFEFREVCTKSPAVVALIEEVRALGIGINYSQTTDAYRLRDLLRALNSLWY